MTDSLTSLTEFRAVLAAAPAADATSLAGAAERNGMLTKPPGALGRLEDLAIWYAGWRGTARPEISAPQVIVFAGNHGVTARGISAFPPEVTEQMVLNFQHGGAAINQLSKAAGAQMDVHAIDLDRPTRDFCDEAAMDEAELLAAINVGWTSVNERCDLLVTGEMGIGNTTSAAAIALALYGGDAAEWTGRGTGLDDQGVSLKAGVVAQAVALHQPKTGLDVLRTVGGREIAAMAGAIARARVLRIPVILDGFICCAAAACLLAESETALDHAIAGHASAEAAHPKLLARLDKEPLLRLGLRLGEGSGAALAINILKGAIACHSGMSTFAEAGVSAG
ncbi:nicotinate-nucleotide--dimethylbenzimidazole phosphoribosyltransferase [Pseudooceanicola sediminis]|uniref:Nicotinate-nucleotide--dimethylbenzimidazole phosphoribosyltransferase n=1 Tax=Pseudooceanicola sediminis TaxID=2211117 RepID=A0A399IYC1_9RHOB|nr:nicotinate-nucleotide--dimethylbenzimidazole phosphoribosyltransferase [Pseudooceanicola sediminis]KAA2312065.1 nicotinate-nucleotide--dimethylbenzimidazole phosphoribosyltransferase [Puniceibacterium sp. HSS470]RII38075.1 nicotinate-nucleotide--dimethylbenzimidazole phosphoribosyltransferase [Pseudooceanicola sediminis]|tara:strand:+ start:12967 stop:13977 length:1011 start_codon:yes stop_codon:yes gene_type:complete